ncbi:MAG: TonB-dependent receptor [Terriglobales bacterium]
MKVDQAAVNIHRSTTSSASGVFSFPNLPPGAYKVTVTAHGFQTLAQVAVVQVGTVSDVIAKLKVGASSTTVEVTGTAGAAMVDTTTATVSGIVGTTQIQNLPQLGRNFLTLAQLQPGVQMIDGGQFDPTKNGFAGLSVEGSFGRTTEVNVDGIDITDQTVGTVTQNLSDLSIKEFQVSQSSGDTSSDIGNQGQVNIITKSGSNAIHGDGFALYRNQGMAANPTLAATKPDFSQNQDGLDLGGPLVRNKLFWFVSGERHFDASTAAVDMPDFPSFDKAYQTPGYEYDADARLDWQISQNLHFFYRFTNFDDKLIPPSTVGGTSLSPFTNQDVTNTHELALDWSTARYTNAFRYGHTGFFNHIFTQPLAGSPPIPIGITFGDTGETFGPNDNAPQHTFQLNNEFKYDGSAFFGNTTLRYGVEFDRIGSLVYASFFGQGPLAVTLTSLKAPGLPAGQPTSYVPLEIIFGNGLGDNSNLPIHGQPYGGIFNNRFAFYLADNWKATPNLSINLGVHFERDPGEVNNDLVKPAVLDQFSSSLGHFAPVPNNWSPTVGIAWDPTGHGTTSIRVGAGMYYQNNVFNNVMFERTNYISSSIGNFYPFIFGGQTLLAANPNVCIDFCNGFSSSPVSSESIGASQSEVLKDQAALQASYAALPKSPLQNPAMLHGGSPALVSSTAPMFDSTYRTPYSVQWNVGIEHQFAPGMVLSVNYVDNHAFDLMASIDDNQVGNARYLDKANAVNAINQAAADLGVKQGTSPLATMDNLVAAIGTQPNPNSTTGATITQADVQGELMGTSGGYSLGSGSLGATNQPGGFAFAGSNPAFGTLSVVKNALQSDYRALQVKFDWTSGSLVSWLHAQDLTVGYALGRVDSSQSDGAFVGANSGGGTNLSDQYNPRMFYGPNGFDRASQLSIGGIFNLPWGFMISTVNHFATGFAVTPTLGTDPVLGGSPLEIFATDWTGDGSVGDVVPGTNIGSFDRSISNPQQLQALVNAYNTHDAGTLTPAGKALVSAGLASTADLQALGLMMPFIEDSVPSGQLMTDSLLDTDIRIAKHFNFHTGDHTVVVTPMLQIFNLFNVGNYDPPGAILTGALDTGYGVPMAGKFGPIDSIAGTTALNQANKFGLNTGVFAQGIPRALQVGVRVDF